MARTRRKSGKRLIVNCFWKCLKEETYPHLLKWTGRGREFSLFLRRKGSPTSDLKDLDFFKELDSVSPTKHEKYINQSDYGQACKRRCKANLRKLCENNVFEFVGKKDIDKCTKLLYYNFLEIPSDEDIDNKLLLKCIEKRTSIDSFSSSDESVPTSTFSSDEYVQTPISIPSRKRKYDELVSVVDIEEVDNEVPVVHIEEVDNEFQKPQSAPSSSMRRIKCGRCDACKRPDCLKCIFCRDMTKYGGPGKKKKSCIRRKCMTSDQEEDYPPGWNFPSDEDDPVICYLLPTEENGPKEEYPEKENDPEQDSCLEQENFLPHEVKVNNSNYNFVQPAEDNSKSSHRCLDENLLPEDEASFNLNAIENRENVADKTSEIYDSFKSVKTGLISHGITDPRVKDYLRKMEDCQEEMSKLGFLSNSEMSLYQCLEKDSVDNVSSFQALWSDSCAPKISKTMAFEDVVDAL